MATLVTGALGFVGSRIVRELLQAGKRVVGLDVASDLERARAVLGPDIERLVLRKADIRDGFEVNSIVQEERVDAIVHAAFAMEAADYRPAATQGTSGLGATRRTGEMAGEVNLRHALDVNCVGMLNVLEACRLFGVRRLVYTSAVAAFGRHIGETHSEPIGDEGLFQPDTMYGATKVVNEVMARIYAERFGIASIGFRIARTYGPGNPAPFSLFIRNVAVGEPVEIVDPAYFNAYISVDDCAAAHARACDAATDGARVYNLSEGEYDNQTLVTTLRRIMPSASIQLKLGRGDGICVPHMRPSRLREELGWTPRFDLEAGLRAMINHYREEVSLPAV